MNLPQIQFKQYDNAFDPSGTRNIDVAASGFIKILDTSASGCLDMGYINTTSYDYSAIDTTSPTTDWGGFDQVFSGNFDPYTNYDFSSLFTPSYDYSVVDPTQDWGGYDQIFASEPAVDTSSYSDMYSGGIYGPTKLDETVYNPNSNYNTYAGGGLDANGNYVKGDPIVNDANGNPLGYIDANGQYQSYKELRQLNPAEQASLAAQEKATAQKAAQSGSGGGSSGGSSGGSQQKQPVQSTAQSSVGSLAMLAQLLQAIKGKGAIAPAGIGTNKAATPMQWGGIGARHNFAKGGLNQCSCGGPTASGHIKHATGGQADKVEAQLSGGEYVMDADTVASLGDGNTDAGAAKLDEMRYNIREHKRAAPADKIPPKAKSPLAYMKGAK